VLSDLAWANFGATPGGWGKVQAVCDYVHRRLQFDYRRARATRTAVHAQEERTGVCRDFAHLAIALCRSLNIPARYATGYLGDIGVPADPSPMDFSAWFEAYLDGRWWSFDARHNTPRIGRVVLAYGRDAADTPILHSFGTHELTRFEVVTEEASPRLVRDERPVAPRLAA
jgi:transglutaminase-like putative cysteine protease